MGLRLLSSSRPFGFGYIKALEGKEAQARRRLAPPPRTKARPFLVPAAGVRVPSGSWYLHRSPLSNTLLSTHLQLQPQATSRR